MISDKISEKVAKLAKTGYEVCAHDFAHLLST